MALHHPSLIPLSWLYRMSVAARNMMFERGMLRITDIGVPVISIGNVTVGGTGKTPLVEYVIQYCLGRGNRVAIISRGYKRESKGVVIVSDGTGVMASARQAGDEPMQMAMKLPQAIVAVGERKVETAGVVVRSCRPDLIVVDDGFQHRYLKRNLDIVVVNAARDNFPGELLPAGRNREPWSSVRRAGLVGLSHAERVGDVDLWSERLHQWYTGPWIAFHYRTTGIGQLPGNTISSVETLKNRPVVAFSGIGHHRDFLEGVRMLGCRITAGICYPDHHTYTDEDVANIVARVEETSAECCLTTEKDAMRLTGVPALVDRLTQHCPVFYSMIEVQIVHGKETLHALIDKCMTERPS